MSCFWFLNAVSWNFQNAVAARQHEDALRRFGRGLRVVVERKRLVLPDDADLVRAVRRLDLIERRLDARAERALEVARTTTIVTGALRLPHTGSLLSTGIGESLSDQAPPLPESAVRS